MAHHPFLSMSYNLLILTPPDILPPPKSRVIIETLQRLKFIDKPFDFSGSIHYKPGEEFLHLITFLGCSPVVSLGSPGGTGEEFAHIEICGPYSGKLFIGGQNMKPIRCPVCKTSHRNALDVIKEWQSEPSTLWQCPNCPHQQPLEEIKWRRSAGFGQLFLKVWGVFESEAVPGDQLMHSLKEISGESWDYFYFRGDNPNGYATSAK